MATESPKTNAAKARGGPPLRRRWWLAPAIVAGALALVAVVLWHPARRLGPKEQMRQQLQQAERALAAGKAAAAKSIAQSVLNQVESNPRLTGEALFLLGSAELAAKEYRPAKKHLITALRSELPDGQQAKVRYRLAKCEYHLESDRSRVATALENSLADDPEDRVEGYGLLLALWLKEPDPDWTAALKAADKLLAQPGLAEPNPVRLKRGEILLRLGKADDAREVLSRVAPTSGEYPAALSLQARSWYDEGEWDSALELWSKVIVRGPQTPRYAEALYYMGLCYREQERWGEARRVWEQLCRDAPLTDEALPASFHLAEALQKLERDEEALSAFAAAIHRVPPGDPADNATGPRSKYLDLAGARQSVEAAFGKWLEAGKYEPARELAKLYKPMALPGESARRVALAGEAAASAIFRQAEQTLGTEAERLTQLARKEYSAAGEAFAAAAAQRPDAADHTELLWSAALSWLHGQEYAKPVPLLEQLRSKPPARADVMVALAEAYLGQAGPAEDEAGKKLFLDKALQVLLEALQLPGPPAITVRGKYLLGLVRIERREWSEAEAAFKDVVTMPLLAPEPIERRQAVFALGWLLYQGDQFLDAARYFRDAVERYPHDRRAAQARYWLAESYRQAVPREERLAGEADLGPYRERYRQLKRQHLENALIQFQTLGKDLVEAQSQRALTSEEQALLREARFGAADCLFRLEGRAAEGIAIYDDLTRVYAGRVEGLLAFTRLVLCWAQQNNLQKAQSAWSDARDLLSRLSDDELKPTKRLQWEEWLNEQGKNLKQVGP